MSGELPSASLLSDQHSQGQKLHSESQYVSALKNLSYFQRACDQSNITHTAWS